jgi:hypothetical protein
MRRDARWLMMCCLSPLEVGSSGNLLSVAGGPVSVAGPSAGTTSPVGLDTSLTPRGSERPDVT